MEIEKGMEKIMIQTINVREGLSKPTSPVWRKVRTLHVIRTIIFSRKRTSRHIDRMNITIRQEVDLA